MNSEWNQSSILGKLGVLINEVRAERLNETTLAAFPIIIIRGKHLVSDYLDTWGMCDDLRKKIETTWGVQVGNPDERAEGYRIDELVKRIHEALSTQTGGPNVEWAGV